MDVTELNILKSGCKLTDLDIIGDLLQSMDAGKDFVSGDNNYVWFYLIAKHFRPRVIVEMGTRFGYSLKAFVDGSGQATSLFVWDNESDGIKTLHIPFVYFKNYYMHINKLDTSTLQSIGIHYADLCLVDGKHTAEGCYHECNLGWGALRTGGVLVIDDMKYIEPREGAERFLNERKLRFNYISSLRGIYLIQKI